MSSPPGRPPPRTGVSCTKPFFRQIRRLRFPQAGRIDPDDAVWQDASHHPEGFGRAAYPGPSHENGWDPVPVQHAHVGCAHLQYVFAAWWYRVSHRARLPLKAPYPLTVGLPLLFVSNWRRPPDIGGLQPGGAAFIGRVGCNTLNDRGRVSAPQTCEVSKPSQGAGVL